MWREPSNSQMDVPRTTEPLGAQHLPLKLDYARPHIRPILGKPRGRQHKLLILLAPRRGFEPLFPA